ncbi:hypothetical protein Q8A73_020756 [Channa argus]|nr:hypothetical protein Q8A73_020756 [Channa argus]
MESGREGWTEQERKRQESNEVDGQRAAVKRHVDIISVLHHTQTHSSSTSEDSNGSCVRRCAEQYLCLQAGFQEEENPRITTAEEAELLHRLHQHDNNTLTRSTTSRTKAAETTSMMAAEAVDEPRLLASTPVLTSANKTSTIRLQPVSIHTVSQNGDSYCFYEESQLFEALETSQHPPRESQVHTQPPMKQGRHLAEENI